MGSETAFRTSAQDHTRAENLALTAVSEVLSVAYEFYLVRAFVYPTLLGDLQTHPCCRLCSKMTLRT